MNNLRDIQTIEKYLKGALTEAEMEEVEIRTLQDTAFLVEFQTVKLLVKGIKESAQQTTLKEKIQRLESTVHAASSNTIVTMRAGRNRVVYGLVAAVVLFLIMMPFLSIQKSSPEELFNRHFAVSPNMGLQTSRSDIAAHPAYPAYQAYELGNYAEAARLFESIIEGSDHRNTDLFHLGNCYLVLGAWDPAIEALEQVVTSETTLTENARWYLALAYLRVSDSEKARILLEEVAAPNERAKKARKIFKQLE